MSRNRYTSTSEAPREAYVCTFGFSCVDDTHTKSCGQIHGTLFEAALCRRYCIVKNDGDLAFLSVKGVMHWKSETFGFERTACLDLPPARREELQRCRAAILAGVPEKGPRAARVAFIAQLQRRHYTPPMMVTASTEYSVLRPRCSTRRARRPSVRASKAVA